jgi:hypothetical protein
MRELERQTPRVKISMTFVLPDGWRAEVVDASATGLKVRSVAVLPKESEFEGELVYEDQRIPLWVVVVWVEPADLELGLPAQMGLQLRQVPEAYLELLARIFADEE